MLHSTRVSRPSSKEALRGASSSHLEQRPAAVMFFGSGTAALIFEVVWFHRCGLIFGSTVWASSIVLSSFMGGLAVGNALTGWLGHKITRHLKVYAALEAMVGVSGLVLT